jgi:hypothetical protein
MEKGLPLNRIANVTVTLSARAAQGRNFGSMLILGDSTVIPISERLRLYSSADDIGDDFGVDSQVCSGCYLVLPATAADSGVCRSLGENAGHWRNRQRRKPPAGG